MVLGLRFSREGQSHIGDTMVEAKLDIFKKLPDGQPIWIKAVNGFNEAKLQLTQLAASSPGDYFIFNTRTGQVIDENPCAAKVA
jgi:hypothetical protein